MKQVPRWKRIIGPPVLAVLRNLAYLVRRLHRGEPQTCPRRTGEIGPWERGANLDTWRRDRWHPLRALADRWQDATDPNFSGGTYWPEGFEPPRTCSFCGGVHPLDAIALILAGWVSGGTDKSYKKYLEPPRRAWGTLSARMPVPPVKLYTPHFNEPQIARFNEALGAQDRARAAS